MDPVEIVAQPRSIVGKKVKRLRAEELVPLVVYGKTESKNIQAAEVEVQRAIARASGQLMTLRIEGEDEPRSVLARELQRDALSGRLLHADFYEVDITEKLQVDVQVTLTGKEPNLAEIGEAMVLQALNAVEIECLPTDILQSIEVDISGLVEINDAIFVRDLVVPEGIEIVTSGDEMIARLQPIYEEEEEEEELELEEVLVSPEVEVIQRGREEEGEAEEIEE